MARPSSRRSRPQLEHGEGFSSVAEEDPIEALPPPIRVNVARSSRCADARRSAGGDDNFPSIRGPVFMVCLVLSSRKASSAPPIFGVRSNWSAFRLGPLARYPPIISSRLQRAEGGAVAWRQCAVP
jgi:hypothetical protein